MVTLVFRDLLGRETKVITRVFYWQNRGYLLLIQTGGKLC